jgi:hypothetical protein
MRGVNGLPCPDCGSQTGVQWRKRNFFDKVLTWARMAVDFTIRGSAGSATPPIDKGAFYNPPRGAGNAYNYGEMREAHELSIGTKTAAWFWSCRACYKNGSVFDDETIAEMERSFGVLGSLENDILAGGGDVQGQTSTNPSNTNAT